MQTPSLFFAQWLGSARAIRALIRLPVREIVRTIAAARDAVRPREIRFAET